VTTPEGDLEDAAVEGERVVEVVDLDRNMVDAHRTGHQGTSLARQV
jgi:hypothetical protein